MDLCNSVIKTKAYHFVFFTHIKQSKSKNRSKKKTLSIAEIRPKRRRGETFFLSIDGLKAQKGRGFQTLTEIYKWGKRECFSDFLE
ncbi:hypothetical protein ES288_A08G263600v1 [Gossypium darwinii]|uniref:Uncharacterized protein n=1 Tax=Gossypium darwinii TaxID=34276 RepID=A0A5D2FPE8_GOSDA|nr:hypothetical protein ES288_A08G263600v1 [Gossypium darwinii]